MAGLLEALAIWKQERLCVLLVADEQAGSCCGAAYEALADVGKLYYEVGVCRATPTSPDPDPVAGAGKLQ